MPPVATGSSVVKNPPASTGGTRKSGSIPGAGKILPGEGNGNLLQYACLGNPTDNRAWQATLHGVARSQTQLNTHICLALIYCCLASEYHVLPPTCSLAP